MAVVAAAFAPLAGAFTGAALPAAGTGLLASTALSTTLSSLAVTAFKQIAVGLALSAAAKAIAPKPKAAPRGSTISLDFGESNPGSMILGRASTGAELLYHGSFGHFSETPNAFYVQVIELADFPARLARLWINGEWVTLGETPHPEYGRPVVGYDLNGEDYLWVKFYSGTQTAPDQFLIDTFGDDEDRPWESDMIGLGMPYLIVTARFKPKLHQGRPQVVAELASWGHYDRRKDSSVGGTGAQRWNDWRTWQPSNNPIVLADNVVRGIADPITGELMWGGQDIPARDLPASVWTAAMNECDASAETNTGTEPQYRGGLEIRFDEEPAGVVEELLKGCAGAIAEAAGEWLVRAGPPGVPVYSFTDDDVIITSPEVFDPFPGLDETYNEVRATYPEPEEGWQAKDAPARTSAAYLAEDGRRNTADLQFLSVPYRFQVQRLMRSALEDARRFRRHGPIVLPPDARALAPLDVVAWTSERYGYSAKLFEVGMVEDLPNGCVALALREIDPDDYDWNADLELPAPVGWQPRPIRPVQTADFSVEAATIKDANGVDVRPAIRLNWTVYDNVDAIAYEVRLAADQTHVPVKGESRTAESAAQAEALTYDGDAVTYDAEAVTYTVFTNVADGEALIHGGSIMRNTDYEVRALYLPEIGREWSDWLSVTTPDIGIPKSDLSDEIQEELDQAREDALAARYEAGAAFLQGEQNSAALQNLAGDTIYELEALLASLQNVDAQDIIDARLAALRSFQGWNKDPTFAVWAAGVPTHWTLQNAGAYVSEGSGYYGGALEVDSPTGASLIWSVRCHGITSGQMPAADPSAEWIIVYALIDFRSGDPDAMRMRAVWRQTGSSTYVNGNMRGLTAPAGTFTQHGISAKPGTLQGVEFLVQKPASVTNPDDVALWLVKHDSVNSAVDMTVHLLGIRKASEAEIAAGAAAGLVSAAVTTLTTEITGVSDALAAQSTTLTAMVNDLSSEIAITYVAQADLTNTLNALQISLASTILGQADASATQKFYTRAQVDGKDAAVTSSLSTSLGARIDGVEATVTSESAARVDGDTALSGRIDAIEVRRDPDSVIVNGDFGTGDLTGWSRIPSTTGNVYVQGGGSAPTSYILRIDPTSQEEGVINQHFPAKEGDRFGATFMYTASGVGRDVTLRLRIYCYDKTGAQIGSHILGSGPDNYTGTSWARWETPESDPCPAGTASVRVRVGRTAGGGGMGYMASIIASRVQPVVRAGIQTAQATAVSASQAIATLSTEISAEFGSSSAFLTEMKAVSASQDLLGSTWVLRQRAGQANGYLEAVAYDDPEGDALSTFRLSYDFIDLDGRVTARDMLVTPSWNEVRDPQLADAGSWEIPSPFQHSTPVPNGPFRSVNGVSYIHSGGTGFTATVESLRFPVEPETTYYCSFQTRRATGSQFRCRTRILWFDADNEYLEPDTIDTSTTSTAGVNTKAATIVSPVGAQYAVLWMDVDRSQTDGNFWWGGPLVREKAPGVTHITDGGIYTDLLAAEAVTADKIKVSSLQAVSGWIGELNIADGAVTIEDFDYTPGPIDLTDSEQTIATCTITRKAGFVTRLEFCCQFDGPYNTSTAALRFKFYRNGSLVREAAQGNNPLQSTFMFRATDTNTAGGASTYTVAVYRTGGTGGHVYSPDFAVQQFKK